MYLSLYSEYYYSQHEIVSITVKKLLIAKIGRPLSYIS